VALNCVANGRLLREGPFREIWIQPAAGDAGGAVGVALAVAHTVGGAKRRLNGAPDGMAGAYLGPGYSDREIAACLEKWNARYERVEDDALVETVADALVAGKVIGWFQGRMEFGPRALGNRSILADARSPAMQRLINLKVKYRESFRPFAPVVLREDVADWFELGRDSPYMLLVAQVAPARRRALTNDEAMRQGLAKLDLARSEIPAVTHVDDSARVQTVTADSNPRLHALIGAFKARTGCGVLVNTSFNVRDEPIVCSPDDAYRCFMGSEIDMLVAGNYVLRKESQR
jgi:carbamoyltransferase